MEKESKKFYETEKFKKIQKRWYAKLKESGFVDIEETEDEYIVRPEVFNAEPLEYKSGTDYRKMCEEILNTAKFRTDVHREIFHLHTDGVSEREIAKEIERKFGETFARQVINRFINRMIDDYKKGTLK